LSLLLFWLGGASLAASLIIGLQVLAVPRLAADLGGSSLAIPGWGFVSVALALVLRRNAANRIASFLGAIWLLMALAAIGWLKSIYG
jgi:hypothetical protein